MIKRRHVIYVPGYDPAGSADYYRLFQEGRKKLVEIWPVKSTLGELVNESADAAHWDVTTEGPNWSVGTRYDFLRCETMVNANLSQSVPQQMLRAFRWLFNDLVTGTTWRIIQASWRFWAHLFVMQLGLLLWIATSILAGWLTVTETDPQSTLPPAMGVLIGIGIAILVFVALKPVAERLRIIQLNDCWPRLREFGHGDTTCFDLPITTGVERLRAAVAANTADEIVVIGHSSGGPMAMAIVERALDIEPDLSRRGPRVVLLTLGSVMPAIALHPQAQRMRDIVRRIAVDPSVRWIDCQSREDPMNFWDFDPVGGIGVDIHDGRVNPGVWVIRFRDMLSPEYYRRIRLHFLRLHQQYIMGGDRRSPYDYLMMVCGPLPIEDWGRPGADVLAHFTPDAALVAVPTVESRPAGS